MILRDELVEAFAKAINVIGLETFKRTTMFSKHNLTSKTHLTADENEPKAA